METPKEELTTGATFSDRYQIIEELGKGRMGRVYKAYDTDIKEKGTYYITMEFVLGDNLKSFMSSSIDFNNNI